MSYNNSNVFERHPKKTLGIMIFVFFLIFDFSGAAILKLLGLFEPSYTSSKTLEAVYRRSDPVIHHTLRKNIDFDKAEWGEQHYTVHTNSLGFKDRKIREVSLKSSHQRLLFMGDSFTEGVGIEYDKTFVGIIDEQLANRNIEVLNAGVSSYSPIIYLRKTEHLINDLDLKFNHMIVLVDLSDIEDEALSYTFDAQHNVVSRGAVAGQTTVKAKQEQSFNLKEFLTQYTIFTGRLRNLSSYLRQKKRTWRYSLNQHRALWTMDNKLYEEYGIQGLELAKKHMSELKQLLDKHRIQLTLAVYPWPDQIFSSNYPNKQSQAWQAWTQQHNVPFIDLFPAFINNDAEQTIKTYFIKGDVHWNEKGHALIADQILKSFPIQ